MRVSHLITLLSVVFVLMFIPIGYTQTNPTVPPVSTEEVEIIDGCDTLVENCILPSVKVVTDRGRGSGTIINERYILTACHVIDDATEINILLQPEMEAIPCEVVIKGDLADRDYAILKVKEEEEEALSGVLLPEVAEEEEEEILFENYANVISAEDFENLRTGDDLFAVGYPLGGELHITKGVLCSASNGFYSTSACVIYGNSGGGIYTEDNRLFGVVVRIAVSGWTPISHVSFVVPISNVRADIHEHEMDFIWDGELPPESDEEEAEPEEEEAEPEEGAAFLQIGSYDTILLDMMYELRRD